MLTNTDHRCLLRHLKMILLVGLLTCGAISRSNAQALAVGKLEGHINTLATTDEVFYLGSDQHINELSWSSATGWHSSDVTSAAGAPIAAGGSPVVGHIDSIAGTDEVFYIGSNQHVYQLFWSPSAGRNFGDLTLTTGAPAAVAGSGLSSQVDTIANTDEVFYIGSNQHVYELFYSASSGWNFGDLTAVTGTALAVSGSPIIAHTDSIAGTDEAFYIGSNQHVYELFYSPSAGWNFGDLTLTTGAPAAVAGSGLSSHVDMIANTDEVFYIGSNQHVYELFYSASSGWNFGDLTLTTGAPAAVAGSGLSSHVDTIANTDEVFYIGANQHMYELFYSASSGWNFGDLTLTTGATAARTGSGITSYINTIANTDEVFFVGPDQHIDQLWWDNMTGWHPADVTAAAEAILIDNGNLDDLTPWGSCDSTNCNPTPPTTFEFNQNSPSPSLDGGSIETFETGPAFWGILYFYHHTLSTTEQAKTNYRVEWNFNVENTSFQGLEFDAPVALNNLIYYFGTQCAVPQGGGSGKVFQYWNPNNRMWNNTTFACDQIITANAWHTLVLYGTRTSSQFTYVTLSIDGQQFSLNKTLTAPANTTGIANNTMTVQFQKDGNSSGTSYHMYVDEVNAWIW
jgi:hypothetical protein